MAAGAAGGFTGGVIGTSLAGGNFSEAISAGFQGMVIGGMMGGITAGIGSAFGTVGSMAADAAKKFNVWNELGRAGVHAVAQGGFSYMRNGNFWQGAAAGFVSSFAGSLSQGAEIHGWGMVAVSTAMGGVGASIGGARSAEEILFGMVSGTMVGMLNHMAGEIALNNAVKRLVIGWSAALAEPTPVGEIAMAAATAAAVAYYGPEILDKMQIEIAQISQKINNNRGVVYELRVNNTGTYIDVRGNAINLRAGDVWKYGQTTQGSKRYTTTKLENMVPGGVKRFDIFQGNVIEIRIQEKIMIYGYAVSNGHLPPGNSIFR